MRSNSKFGSVVGRVTPCAPPLMPVPPHGAHGVTRPTTPATSGYARRAGKSREDEFMEAYVLTIQHGVESAELADHSRCHRDLTLLIPEG